MKVLVTGAGGQLGRAVCAQLQREGIPFVGLGHRDFDLNDRTAVSRCVRESAADAIIHCAAYTDVDRAELEPEKCMAVNSVGTAVLAQSAREAGARLLLVSTDYVFSGEKADPYLPQDRRAPVNVYGLSKLQAEEAVRSLCKRSFIVRTSWLFSAYGSNFVTKILRAGRDARTLRVVCDQVGSPTYAPDLAVYLCQLIRTNHYGIWHAVGEGFCTRDAFAAEILREACLPCQVVPIPSAASPTLARRPLNSRLSCEEGGAVLPAWQSGLSRCIAEMRRHGEL